MIHILSAGTRYLSIILFCIYVLLAFFAISENKTKRKKRAYFFYQAGIISFIYLMYMGIGYLKTGEIRLLIFGIATYLMMLIMVYAYGVVYRGSNKFLLNNIWMMLSIGFLMLSRISYTKAVRQAVMCLFGMLLSMLFPYLISKRKELRYYAYSYAIAGILLLALVLFLGNVTYGAKISLSLGPVSIQPSEFIKISYPIFIAALLSKKTDLKQVLITSVLAAVHILLLVCSSDLGTALIFAICYLFMLYVATGKKELLLLGLLAGSAASCAGYLLFSHVQVRVAAWLNPWPIIEDKGYQIAQSLFAIGMGSSFGMGLYEGNPNYIPVAEQDFIFSAIAEELGGFFALSLILLCVHTFVLIFKIGLKCKDSFYKLTCTGFGIIYGIQVFLTIGGAVKLIPSTGVTLPFVSYGGSSLISTLFMFSMIQGFNIYDAKEREKDK